MQRMKKITSVLLSGCMIFAAFAACKKDDNASSSSQDGKEETRYTLFENGQFAYKAVIPENATVNDEFAVGELNTFLYESCGVEIKTVADTEVTDADKCIFIGATKQTLEKNFTVSADEVTSSGYLLKTADEDVYINGATYFGTNYGVYDFLKELIGFEVYTYDEIYVEEKDVITFPEMDIVYKPYVEWRGAIAGVPFSDTLAATRMRLHLQKDLFNMTYQVTHTSFNFLSPSVYLETHSDWYSDERPTPYQLCYTAHGNEKELAAMKNEVLQKMKDAVISDATSGNIREYISFTHQDFYKWCTCEDCLALKEKYETDAASMILFLNPIAEELNAWIAEEYPGNHVNIVFFAYYNTEKAPVVKNDAGEYVPIDDSVKMSKYITTWYAPFYENSGESFYHESNASFYDTMKRWAAISSDMMYWGYGAFDGTLVFKDTFGSMFETYKIAEEFNVSYFFDQGKYYTKKMGGFSEFKSYLNAKLLWDINQDYVTLRENFFDNYFGQASTVMQNIFEETRTWAVYQRSLGHKFALGNLDYVSTKYWPQKTLENFIAMFDGAYKAIEPLKRSNPERYQTLYDRISAEELGYTIMLINLYGNTMTKTELYALQAEWKAEFLRLGFTKKGEGGGQYWDNW